MSIAANIANKVATCRLTREEEALLRACVLQGEAAVVAWKEWTSLVDPERVPPEDYALLPLLYRNLHDQGVEPSLLVRLKGLYRRSWCENQLKLRELAALVQSFREARIQSLLLHGALSGVHCRELGLRPVIGVGILVREEMAGAAMELLKLQGWSALVGNPERQ